MSEQFKDWNYLRLLDFLKFIEYNFPEELKKFLDAHDEWMRGN